MKAFLCYLSTEQKRALEQLAKKRDRKMAELVRRAVDEFLSRETAKRADRPGAPQ